MADENYTHKVWSSRVTYNADDFVGETGKLFYDEATGTLRISDGITPGGVPIVTGSSGGSGGQTFDQNLNTTNNVTFNSVSTSTVTAGNVTINSNLNVSNVTSSDIHTANINVSNISASNISTGNVTSSNVNTSNISASSISTGNVTSSNISTGNISAPNGLGISTPLGSSQNIEIRSNWSGTGISGGIDLQLINGQGFSIKTADNTYAWKFDNVGKLNFPSTSNVASGAIKVNDASKEISFGTGTGNIAIWPGSTKWLFDTTGNLSLPFGGTINDSTGVSVIKNEPNFEVITINFNALSGHRYGINTTSNTITAILPPTPNTGDAIFFVDVGGNFSMNNFTISRNGSTIMDQTSDLTVSINNQSFGLMWSGTTWRVY